MSFVLRGNQGRNYEDQQTQHIGLAKQVRTFHRQQQQEEYGSRCDEGEDPDALQVGIFNHQGAENGTPAAVANPAAQHSGEKPSISLALCWPIREASCGSRARAAIASSSLPTFAAAIT